MVPSLVLEGPCLSLIFFGFKQGLFCYLFIKNMARTPEQEKLRVEFLAQPVVGAIVDEIDTAVKENPEIGARVKWIAVSGSKARQAELKGEVGGVISDDDLVILLDGAQEDDPVNLDAYDLVLDAMNVATRKIMEKFGTTPVFASTIRLEDAQMAIARLVAGPDANLHMVHSLIYPSARAALAFEPPKLTRGLFGQSLGLWGDEEAARQIAEMARAGVVISDHNLTVRGLDGISDNFRMLRTNRHVLPVEFLGPQTIHVLDYSLKWAMANVVEDGKNIEVGTWEEIIDNFPNALGSEALVTVVHEIRRLRSMGSAVDLDEVEGLYRGVIKLWPVLTELRISNGLK